MSGNRILLRSGYDFERRFSLSLDGQPEDLSAATITASLKNQAKTSELIADVSQANTGAGVSWSTGEVAVRFPAASTAALQPASAWLEIAVVLGGKRLAYEDIPVVIETGHALT
ncbi:MAG: hypothetical protein H0W48_00505 [Methylibium sp.]|nr:hypothetical protein [Methylibium sp.]